MIEVQDDQLVFSFPEVHPEAKLNVSFMRTLRIPDDGKDYPLPAGLGRFPIRHVDDFGEQVPSDWRERGGVMFPMYQSEALWLDFDGDYPFALKVATGKINAVSGTLGFAMSLLPFVMLRRGIAASFEPLRDHI